MENPLVLTFDVGTQSLRAMLVDSCGNIVHIVQKKYAQPYFSKEIDYAEQKPSFYFDMLCLASKELKEKAPTDFDRAIAATITVIRDTCLCLDENNEPLRDIIVWLDKRRADNLDPMPLASRAAFKLVNMEYTVEMQRRASICNWIYENEKEVWAKTKHFVMLSTYLNYLLTGRLVDSAANQIGHIPFDYKNRCWRAKNDIMRPMFAPTDDMLCEIIDSGKTIGTITKECSAKTGIKEGLELIATGSDKACETIGLSCLTPDKAAISYGTSATVQVTTKRYFEPQQFAPSYPAVPNDMYNPEVQIYRGYWLLSWFKKEFAQKECVEAERLGVSAESLLNEHLKEIPAGSEGLMIQPYWTPGVVTPFAKGAMIGFSDAHTRIHIYRAIIEGISYGLMEGMHAIEKRGKLKIKELFIGGGGSQSDEICQITANMFGLPASRIQTHEACGLGSSMVAFIAKGVYSSYDEAAEGMIRKKDTFYPDEREHKIYKELYENIYLQIYGRLEPLYKEIKRILYTK